MKVRRFKIGLAIMIASVAIAASPPASALECDVGGVAAITEVQMGANPATLAQEGVALHSLAADTFVVRNEVATITATSAGAPEVATITSSAASEENYAALITTVNISAQGALVHSPALFVDQQFASAKSHVFHQEGGDAASGAWLVIRC